MFWSYMCIILTVYEQKYTNLYMLLTVVEKEMTYSILVFKCIFCGEGVSQ